jgi:hypothetical protein
MKNYFDWLTAHTSESDDVFADTFFWTGLEMDGYTFDQLVTSFV